MYVFLPQKAILRPALCKNMYLKNKNKQTSDKHFFILKNNNCCSKVSRETLYECAGAVLAAAKVKIIFKVVFTQNNFTRSHLTQVKFKIPCIKEGYFTDDLSIFNAL